MSCSAPAASFTLKLCHMEPPTTLAEADGCELLYWTGEDGADLTPHLRGELRPVSVLDRRNARTSQSDMITNTLLLEQDDEPPNPRFERATGRPPPQQLAEPRTTWPRASVWARAWEAQVTPISKDDRRGSSSVPQGRRGKEVVQHAARPVLAVAAFTDERC